LHGLVEDLLLLVGYGADNRTIEVDNHVPEDLVCDLPETGARHALMSLLTNALEAQQGIERKHIGVMAEDLGDEVRIAVRDRGPGFARQELGGASGRGPWGRAGPGLGLAVVRRFVDYLGGRLVLENLEGGGAQAVMYIPREVQGG
jgi:signal transduction histidine kinase